MQIRYFQKGFNFSQDGPGNRLVYHLQGCNYTCPWCANPEGINPTGTVMVCGKLSEASCKFGAVVNGKLERSKCSGCNAPCAGSPASNLKLSCVTADVDEIVAECLSCSMMFFDGGGVTLTGGEPTMQFAAVKELLTKLKSHGINTAIESNASHIRLPELFELTDYLITDCKHYDSDIQRRFCGDGNEAVIHNIALASKQRRQLLVRIPLISGFNASENDAKGFAELFRMVCSPNCCYELLRYHEFGKDKFAKCGMQYKVENGFVSDTDFDRFKKVFKDNGLSLIHT